MSIFKYICGNPSEKENYDGDSGLDLHCPNITVPAGARSFKIDLGIKGEMLNDQGNIPYMLVPRSSMGSKTPLRLSNSIGIIDRSYRGSLMAFVDNVSDIDYNVEEGQRLFQLVCFDGSSITPIKVEKLSETKRGEKGFGSTGV